MATDPAELREAYDRGGLSRRDLHDNPMATFAEWFDQWVATDPHDPSRVALATVAPGGRPEVRYVLLRGLDHGFVFYTNRRSAKGRALAAHPVASMVFGWIPLMRQVRVTGPVAASEDEAADAYFANRPRGSQLSAWASDQSETLADRAELEARFAEVDQRFAGVEVPRPPHWGGYRLVPDEIEFWQGRDSRMHDRFRYRRPGADDDAVKGPWVIERLAP